MKPSAIQGEGRLTYLRCLHVRLTASTPQVIKHLLFTCCTDHTADQQSGELGMISPPNMPELPCRSCACRYIGAPVPKAKCMPPNETRSYATWDVDPKGACRDSKEPHLK